MTTEPLTATPATSEAGLLIAMLLLVLLGTGAMLFMI
jgi:hypothetical protein